MNPWDIDVTLLSEKYLKKINELESNNLRVPANAILACAILVKTKSKYLKLSSLEEDDEDDSVNNRQLLLEDIPDLVANRSFREGKITLDELVSSIEDIIHRTNPKKNAARIIPRMEINFDSTSIEERMEGLFNSIKQKVDSQGIVLFKNLIDADGVDGVVDTFLPVLFLMNSGKVIAYQNEFFGEIFVQLIQEVTQNPKDLSLASP
jgi:segregation and condensation protein A